MVPITHQTNGSATPTTIAPRPTDEQFLEAWLDATAPLPLLRSKHAISPGQLLAWAAQPHVATLLEQYEQLIARRASTHLAQARAQAIAALLRVIETSDHPETTRRAADRLVSQRAYAPAPTPQGTHALPTVPAPAPQPTSHPPPPTAPSPATTEPTSTLPPPLARACAQPSPASRLVAAAGQPGSPTNPRSLATIGAPPH